MPSTASLAALAAVFSFFANANPISKGQGTFSVQQVASSKQVLRTGAISYRNSLQKFGLTVPPHVSRLAQDQQSGSVTASPTQYDSEYLCPITAGGQSLNMDFDTGSSDLWVFSTELPSSDQGSHSLYDPSSGQALDDTWNISYGDGSGASGNVYADTVVIGGVTATSQAVEAATSISSEFVSGAGDGLVGLAFNSINTVTPTQQQTFFFNVESSLAQSVFCADLKYQAPGSYDFGMIDGSKYTGSITYVPVDNSNGFWGFTADGTSVTSDSFSAIADTGTSLALVDDAVLSAYYGSFGGSESSSAGGYVFDCGTTPPDFSITIGGTSFTIPGAYINYAPNGDGTCFGGLQSNQGEGFSILGDIFLKSVYAIFDGGNTQLGFAAQ